MEIVAAQQQVIVAAMEVVEHMQIHMVHLRQLVSTNIRIFLSNSKYRECTLNMNAAFEYGNITESTRKIIRLDFRLWYPNKVFQMQVNFQI